MSATAPIDGQNDRHDPLASPEIVVCPDGPLLVRGDFDITATDGGKVPRRRMTVALCQCGASGIKPYCYGTHKLIDFRTEFRYRERYIGPHMASSHPTRASSTPVRGPGPPGPAWIDEQGR